MPRRLGRVGFVGSGGGCNGAISVGFLKCLYEKGIVPDFAHKVSVNALNYAACLSSGSTEGLVKTWEELQRKGQNAIFNRRDIPFRIWENSIFSNKGLQVIINSLDAKAIVNSPIEFQFPVHNETRGNDYQIISNHDPIFKDNPELIKRFLLAAISLPGFLEPIEINGEWYSDGLYLSLEEAIQFGCDTIFVLINDQPPLANPQQAKWYSRMGNGYTITHDKAVGAIIKDSLEKHQDFSLFEVGESTPIFKRLLSFTASFLVQGDIDLVPHRIVPIAPTEQIPELSTVGYGKQSITFAIEHGYKCAAEILAKLLKTKNDI